MRKMVKYIDWDDRFSVDVRQIDRQHKHFVGLMNKLFEAMQSDKKDAVSKVIDELVTYADAHFANEEAYFYKFHYDDAEAHIAEHRKIRAEVGEFLARKDENPFELGYSLFDLLEDWLFKHIITMDKKYVSCFKEHGLH
ncbi:MAG: bacteriohemerythrin [Prolixibacteraceae bacterium]|nr:bacteriohemerythrin [Prolixibacteraceae bacterium]